MLGASNAETNTGNGLGRSNTCGICSLFEARISREGRTRLETGKLPRDPILDWAGTACWRLQMPKLTLEMDSGGRIHVGYEVWLSLLKSRRKNSLRNRENALGIRIWTALERCAGSFK
ncbi:hypothetical protein CDL15_Pgr010159 [Punica granatum]|uniref:Uncharacterized protein n=1 Tax=Punica granatum TaxID=22663 RepID=A0A218Y2Q5_PUNGR|nr:hypothetical protein CDL15_Pgr010159 [Punica granatum]